MADGLAWINGGWKQDPHAVVKNGQLGIDVDGQFDFQCVDFSTAYSIYMGAPFNKGYVRNAITLWELPQPGWNHVSTPRPGDVYVKDYWYEGVNYGDTGCVQEVTATGVWVIAQNQINPSIYHGTPPARVFYPLSSMKGYLRRKGAPMTDAQRIALGRDALPEGIHRASKSDAESLAWGKKFEDANGNYTTNSIRAGLKALMATGAWQTQDALIKSGATPPTPLDPGIYQVK